METETFNPLPPLTISGQVAEIKRLYFSLEKFHDDARADIVNVHGGLPERGENPALDKALTEVFESKEFMITKMNVATQNLRSICSGDDHALEQLGIINKALHKLKTGDVYGKFVILQERWYKAEQEFEDLADDVRSLMTSSEQESFAKNDAGVASLEREVESIYNELADMSDIEGLDQLLKDVRSLDNRIERFDNLLDTIKTAYNELEYTWEEVGCLIEED